MVCWTGVEGYSVEVVLWYIILFAIIVSGSPVKKVEALGFGFLGSVVVVVVVIDILEFLKPLIQNPPSETFILGPYMHAHGLELRDNNR